MDLWIDMLRRYLIGLVAGLFLVVLLLYVSHKWAGEQLISNRARTLASEAQQVTLNLDRLLQLRMLQVFTFAALPSLRGYGASDSIARLDRAPVAQTELQAIVAADPMVRSASIVDLTGYVSMTTDDSMNEAWSERGFVRGPLQGQLFASPPARDHGEISQYYSSPILDNAGQVSAVLVVRVAVQEMWNSISLSNTVVIDSHLVRLADTSQAPMPFVAVTPLTPADAAAILSDHTYGTELVQIRTTNLPEVASALEYGSSAVTFRDATGRVAIGAIRQTATNGWNVLVFEYRDVILEPARGLLWANIAVAVICICMGIVITGVSNRVRQLEQESS